MQRGDGVVATLFSLDVALVSLLHALVLRNRFHHQLHTHTHTHIPHTHTHTTHKNIDTHRFHRQLKRERETRQSATSTVRSRVRIFGRVTARGEEMR
jgi:hypothetical protein